MDSYNRLFHLFIALLDGATHAVLRLLGLGETGSHTSLVSLEEFKEMVEGPEMEGVMEVPEREMISAVVDFSEMLVRQVTIPRTEITAVEADTPLSEVIDTAIRNTVTRMPVYEDNLDHVLGVIHLRDLLRCQHDGCVDGQTARELAREVLFVPEATPVRRLLHEFRAHRMQMAIVLDEFGGTAGLVTLEDLLDEIIGEVHDNLNPDSRGFTPQPDGSYLLDGKTLIQEVNEFFNLNLVDPNYDTIAGFVLGKLKRIAKSGDQVEDPSNGITLTVAEMDALRIASVEIRHSQPVSPPVEG
jgi:CBS domain containing-hemolysin-like protein